MSKIPKKIKIIILVFCGLIFLVLNFGFGARLQLLLTENLVKLTDYFFGISTNTLDYSVIATIPFFGLLYNSTRIEFRLKELFIDILTVLLFVLLFIGTGLFIMIYSAKHSNPLIPKYILAEPFELYSTLFICIGIVMPYLIIKFFKN